MLAIIFTVVAIALMVYAVGVNRMIDNDDKNNLG